MLAGRIPEIDIGGAGDVATTTRPAYKCVRGQARNTNDLTLIIKAARTANCASQATYPPDGKVGALHLYLNCKNDPDGKPYTAAFAGLRRGELQGMLWENYQDGFIRVTQAVWEGRVNEPKTRRSRGAVPVIKPLAQRLEMYRLGCGNPTSGPMFKNLVGKPMNLNNLLHREILPALDRCGQCFKSRQSHIKADHKFSRDESIPRWHGWHAARRGLGSNLYSLGVPEKVIQDILRHANVSTTNTYYIKTASEQVTNAMEKLEKALPYSLSVN